MARELDSFLTLQVFDILLIERLAECIPMRGLAPLRMRVRVTGSAALRRHKHLTGNERAGCSSCIAGRKRIGTKFEVVGPGDLLGVALFRRRMGFRTAVCIYGNNAGDYRDARRQYGQRKSLSAANPGPAVRPIFLKCLSHDSSPIFLKTNQKSIWPFITSF